MADLITVSMGLDDLLAILVIAEVFAEHLEACEVRTDHGILPSDRVRGAISLLSRDRSEDA